jgi:glycosyltransferase involved in cell wall biosynthesis
MDESCDQDLSRVDADELQRGCAPDRRRKRWAQSRFRRSAIEPRELAEPLTGGIPTINRPQFATKVVDSARRQSLRRIDVIAVVDGPDEETLRSLRLIDDPRLRVLACVSIVGVGGARLAGVDDARGQWVALLDDDDEWLPRKLEIQLDTARRSRHRLPIVTCDFIARTEHGDVVWPRRRPAQGEALSEYLFCQTRLLGAEGLILPSTILAPRDLFRDIRFRYRGAPFEGSDWLLRAVQCEGASVEFVATREPLALWRGDESRTRMSNTGNWRASLAWANSQVNLLTPRARASFFLIRVSLEARRAGDASAFWLLSWQAFRRGRPTVIGLLAHAIIWLVPRRARFSIAAFITRHFPSRDAGTDAPRRTSASL